MYYLFVTDYLLLSVIGSEIGLFYQLDFFVSGFGQNSELFCQFNQALSG